MLSPVLEIYVVWHPGDRAGQPIADELVRHFHGSRFTGLLGGAVEVYVRNHGWRGPDDAPRPIPMPRVPSERGLPQARFTAVVPLLDYEFAHAVEPRHGPWHRYALDILAGQRGDPGRVAIFPLVLHKGAVEETELGRLLNRFHGIDRGPRPADEPESERRCRDLSQGIAQFAGGTAGGRLTVFISHTNQPGQREQSTVRELISLVRSTIGGTRLDDFFSTSDLQVGTDWGDALRANAASSALLALRTDRYASRAWCQREMLIAKCAGMPIVILDALNEGEERGSFLMDHVPRVPVRRQHGQWLEPDIRRGVNLLVDECLKRTLWLRQRDLTDTASELDVAWWAPHAPEPATFAAWLTEVRGKDPSALAGPVRILHPDPPLGPDERLVLDQIAAASGIEEPLDILTPRSLAARGG
ncbi:hypothetical protein ACI2K4_06720 [Micromonospora sp. NPDC050397]|uniref:hypothetical protein n=1 Tax=Micromonospora sp. NPDC050397 TaxID=3364279 RepID=UPI00384C0F13